MEYYISKTVNGEFDKVMERVTGLLKEEGFGIITEIDVKETFRKKLNKDFRKYRILGACNPNFAYEAIKLEEMVGVLLPCNIVVIDQGEGKIEVAAMNASKTMNIVGNQDLLKIADQVNERVSRALDKL